MPHADRAPYTPVPAWRQVGIGLRAPHYRELLATDARIGWLEVHSENYFGAGGQPLTFLERFRERFALSLHGVGLSLGSVDPLARHHLLALKALVERFEPRFVSDHLCWGSVDGRYLHDLLPMPYTEEALTHFCDRVDQAQEQLGRRMLIENVSSYVRFEGADMPEWDFLAAVARRTGCGLLLDVNNIYVSAMNHGFDARRYVDAIPSASVEEIHLAGFDVSGDLLVDTHGRVVADEVWSLFRHTVQRLGAVPTLIEWDTNIPALPVLLGEAAKAAAILDELGHGSLDAAA
jgi:uncharacterized protein (UPF0276 family)